MLLGVLAQGWWLHHLLNLLWRAWLYLLSALGTTTLGVVVAIVTFVGPLVVTFLINKGWRGDWDWNDLKNKAKKWLIPSGAFTLAIWLCLFAWAVVATIYENHNTLVAERDRLRQERDTMRQERNTIRQERDNLRQEGETLRAAALQQRKDAERPRLQVDQAAQRIAVKDRLGALQRKADTVPPKDEEKAKAWARETRDFIRAAFGEGEAALFLSDAGFTFYGGDEDTRVRNWMIGRLRRLSSLIERADTVAIKPGFKP